MTLEAFARKLSPNSLSEYLSAAKSIEQALNQNEIKPRIELRASLLTSFTTQGLEKVLSVEAAQTGIRLKTQVSAYNQYAQEILNPESELYRSQPQIIFLFIEARTIFGDLLLNPYSSNVSIKSQVDRNLADIIQLLETLRVSTSASIVIHNLSIPTYSPLGILESKQNEGVRDALYQFNLELARYARSQSQVFVFDYESFTSEIGKANVVDIKYFYLADMRLDSRHYQSLARKYLSYVRPLAGRARKCLSLDLDNTLWGGVIGEEGLKGLQLGNYPKGLPFIEFQKSILALNQRGIILAINSKNNLNDALEALQKHPDMILREKHFSIVCANWNEKVDNLREIASRLNIGLDSIVHIDDDKLQCEIIKKELPEVLCIQLPSDPAYYVDALRKIEEFNTLQLTSEDLQKSAQYAAEEKRKEIQRQATDINQYLADLGMVIKIGEAHDLNIARVAQLTQKTNQFNVTTRRYSEEQIKQMSLDSNYILLTADVSDKFGESGLTGVVIVKKTEKASWAIDTFLLSCRVLGRKVEESLLAYVVEQAARAEVKNLVGEFIKTEKNDPAKDLFQRCGFSKLPSQEGQGTFFEYEIDKGFPFPSNVKVIKES